MIRQHETALQSRLTLQSPKHLRGQPMDQEAVPDIVCHLHQFCWNTWAQSRKEVCSHCLTIHFPFHALAMADSLMARKLTYCTGLCDLLR